MKRAGRRKVAKASKEQWQECPRCRGLGEIEGCIEAYDGSVRPLCPECYGSGMVRKEST